MTFFNKIKKLKRVITIIVTVAISMLYTVNAQVAINTDGSAPDASAMLDVKSMNKGFLLPRLNTIQISGIVNPAAGLLVFNSDSSDFYGYNGNKWVSLWNNTDTLADWYCGNPITDLRDNQSYATVQIGTQCWMAENLNIGIMINGNINQTSNDTIEKYCYNNDTSNCDTYGGLYQWDEMMQYVTTEGVQGICPDGWHLPTDAMWKTVEMHLGMTQVQADGTGWRGTDEGDKMKSTSGWLDNGNGTNSSGFTALPGSSRIINGLFYNLGYHGCWWSTSMYSITTTWYREMNSSVGQVSRAYYYKTVGRSIRCLKD